MMTIRQRQLRFFCHVMRKDELEYVILTGKIEWKSRRGRKRLTYISSLSKCLDDLVSINTHSVSIYHRTLIFDLKFSNSTYLLN